MNSKNLSIYSRKIKDSSKRIVVTGGPGAGKTAILDTVRHMLCPHVTILPEAASILFGGGFWRKPTMPAQKAAQRAIFHVQREQERMVEEDTKNIIVLCDRGTLDGLAYWPASRHSFFKEIHSSREFELLRYNVIIHLRTPEADKGYDQSNPFRIENATEAAAIDKLIEAAWRGHPHRHFVTNAETFIEKARTAIKIIESELPCDCGLLLV